jgi:hypothetical protein
MERVARVTRSMWARLPHQITYRDVRSQRHGTESIPTITVAERLACAMGVDTQTFIDDVKRATMSSVSLLCQWLATPITYLRTIQDGSINGGMLLILVEVSSLLAPKLGYSHVYFLWSPYHINNDHDHYSHHSSSSPHQEYETKGALHGVPIAKYHHASINDLMTLKMMPSPRYAPLMMMYTIVKALNGEDASAISLSSLANDDIKDKGAEIPKGIEVIIPNTTTTNKIIEMSMIECQQWIGHIGWTSGSGPYSTILNHQLVRTSSYHAAHVELQRMFDGEKVTLIPPSSLLPPLSDDDEERQYETVMNSNGNQLALVGSDVTVIYNVSDILAMKPSSATTKKHSSTHQQSNGASDDNDSNDGDDTDDETTSTPASVSKQPSVRVIAKKWLTGENVSLLWLDSHWIHNTWHDDDESSFTATTILYTLMGEPLVQWNDVYSISHSDDTKSIGIFPHSSQ